MHDPTDEDLLICKVIRTMRIAEGLTQQELADKIGTTQSAISDIEAGSQPRIQTVRRICKALGYKFIMSIEKWECTTKYTI